MGITLQMILDSKIDKAVEGAFLEGKVREDAKRLLDLARKETDTRKDIPVHCVLGIVWAVLMIFLKLPVAVGLIVLATAAATYWLVKRRRALEREFKSLISSDPDYWEPITERLGQISREAELSGW